MADTTHAEFIQGLRQLAEFYEQHPEVPLPTTRTHSLYFLEKDQIVACARAFGSAKKQYSSESFWLRKEFSGDVLLEVYTERAKVCTPVVVGTKIEPAYYRPAEHVPAKEVPEIEWRCDPILAEPERDPDILDDSEIPEILY